MLLKDRAYLVPGLTFHFEDERDGSETNYYFEGGIKSLVAHSDRGKNPISDVIFISREGDNMVVDIALQYTDSYSENVKGYVNGINTTDGGTHLTGFRIALTRSISDYAKKSGSNDKVVTENGLSGDDRRKGYRLSST
jgi:DNA gyrase subunit B